MKRTTKLAAALTVGATAIGVVIATSPVSTAAGGNGSGSTQDGTGSYATMMGSGGSGYGGMMGGGAGTGVTGRGAAGVGMMGGGLGASSGTGMGAMMGRVLANAPGPRVSTAQAAADAAAVPDGASVDATHNRLTFTGDTVALTLVAGMDEKNPYAFEAAGLTDPQIVVPAGARVTLRLVNADTDAAHGLLVTAAAEASRMPMMTFAAAFSGAAIWALGEAENSGAPTATTGFTATTPGTYAYLCTVPGHTEHGMHGTFMVR